MGIPDGGMFTAEQDQAPTDEALTQGQIPARGVIEVKAPTDDLMRVGGSRQVARYLARYNQVLVTNYWSFVLVAYDPNREPAALESYALAETEQAFWSASPRQIGQTHGVRFIEYLKRVMTHTVPLTTPQDVATFLAACGREALLRVEATDLPALANIRTALEEALGIKLEGLRGEHFFRSTLIQTLFYGIFSAWVQWSKQPFRTQERFEWGMAARYLRVPGGLPITRILGP